MALIAYKCPNCGGEIQFDPKTQKYKCEYCSSLFSQEELGVHQDEDTQTEDQKDSDALIYSCPSCGAQIVTDETTTATFCYYCHTPVVLSGRLKGNYRPDKIIPFQVDRKKALHIFDGWIRQKKYVPKGFYSKEQVDKMSGVYFPYWLYGCRIEGRLDAEATKLNVWTVGNIRYTKTEKYDVSRDGSMEIANVTRNALSKANRELVDSVLPFEMGKLQDFQMDYLAGFLAENRDMEKDKFESQVQSEVQEFAENSMKNQISNYDSIHVRSQIADIHNPQWKYVLLPVWTLTYKEPKTGKVYYFACNGQTGKVCGELPVDNRKLASLFAAIFMPVFIVLMVFWYIL